jgi:hypothetical protein
MGGTDFRDQSTNERSVNMGLRQQQIPKRQRDIRLTARCRQPLHGLSLDDLTGAFARRILERYALGEGHWPRLGVVLSHPWLRRTPGADGRLSLVLAPRVNLALLSKNNVMPSVKNSRFVDATSRRPLALLTQYRQPDHGSSPEINHSKPAEAHAAPLLTAMQRTDSDVAALTRLLSPLMHVVCRITGRGERVEAGLHGSSRSARRQTLGQGDGVRFPWAGSVPRVLYRPAAPSTASESQLASVQSPRPKTRDPISAFDRAAVDVTRLTNEVVQAIDRRIIAQRERLGRI